MLIIPVAVSDVWPLSGRVFASVRLIEIIFGMSDKNKYTSEEAGKHGYGYRNYIFAIVLVAL